MKKKLKDKNAVKDTIGDPAFYNDQISDNKEPIKSVMDKKSGTKFKKDV